MNSVLELQQEFEGAFDLRKPVPHNRASIAGEGPISVLTDEPQWSYAVAFRLRPKALRKQPENTPLLLRIELSVKSGRIGAIFVADDLQTALSMPAGRSAWMGDQFLDIVVASRPSSGWLILRNDAPAGMPSKCEIVSIGAFAVKSERERNGEDVADVLTANSTQIDLAKLNSIVARQKSEVGLAADVLDVLRRKWVEVPAGLLNRCRTSDLSAIPDRELLDLWTGIHKEATSGGGFPVRGWYHEIYKDVLRGKRVLDVGSGLGIDGLTFARHGAQITFVDIVESNLQLLERLCRIVGVRDAKFFYLENLDSLKALPINFDVIWCQGSMINAPFSFMRLEAQALLEHLPIGGRWIELAYPRERWEREGRLPFNEWGRVTDGAGTPWMEWYDLDRIRTRFRPAEFEVVLHFNFHKDDFNWFDLIRRT